MPSQDEATDRGLRLLHVDDEPVNLVVLDQLLQALGHRPTGVSSAIEALGLLQTERFDAVLSDIHMPHLDGVGLLERIRSTDQELPVIAVTADVMSRNQDQYRRLGFVGVLAKPLQLTDVMRLLAEVRIPAARRSFLATGIAKG